MQGISGPESDADQLRFLTATLLSPLGEFFLFHLSSASFYRYPFLSEVLRLPFPLPDAAPGRDPKASVKAVAKIFADTKRDARFGSLGYFGHIEESKRQLAAHVYSYYGINAYEAVLIEDTVDTLKKSAQPARGSTIPTLKDPSDEDRR